MTYTRTTETMLRYAGWFFLATAFSSAASAADYYVSPSGNDANNGTSVSSAWRTIAKANGVLRAGDTLYMRGGEYVDDPIVPGPSGRAGSPIVYTAYQTERPVLTSNRVLGLADAILLRNISYVVVQRVAVDGRAPARKQLSRISRRWTAQRTSSYVIVTSSTPTVGRASPCTAKRTTTSSYATASTSSACTPATVTTRRFDLD